MDEVMRIMNKTEKKAGRILILTGFIIVQISRII
jgi:hypothetical protein